MSLSNRKRTVLVGSAIASALGLLTVAAYMSLRPATPPTPLAPMTLGPSQHGDIVDWCADGLKPIRGGGCFAAPARPGRFPLIVYLHGMFGPENAPQELERQARVARMGTERGFAVLALRGEQGECKNASIPTYWCWPSNARNEADGPAFVARWQDSLDEAMTRTRVKAPRFLLGFSNGAYFATLIATRSLIPFDAIAIAHGGPVEPTHAAGVKMPLLLISADDDPSDPEMGLLDQELLREGWPHEVVAREGGHALLEWDVDVALRFFQRVQSEQLPLAPSLARGRRASSPDDTGAATTRIASSDMTLASNNNTPPAAQADPAPRIVVVAVPQSAPPAVTVVSDPPAPAPPPAMAAQQTSPPPEAQPQPAPAPAPAPTPVPPGVSTSPPAGVPTDTVPSEPYYP